MLHLYFAFIFCSLFYSLKGNGAVCDEKSLLLELKQDLEDNGVLDCLRKVNRPHGVNESPSERNIRIAAAWDSYCSFEAEYDWMTPLREVHNIANLVDDTGDVVEKDFENQADMCEIVRAAISNGLIKSVTTELTKIPLTILDQIDCPGDEKQSEVCAATQGSFFQNDTFHIFLEGMVVTIDDRPAFGIKQPGPAAPKIPEIITPLEPTCKPVVGDVSMTTGTMSFFGNLAQTLLQAKTGKTIVCPDPAEQVKITEICDNECAPGSDNDNWDTLPKMETNYNAGRHSQLLMFSSIGGRFASESHMAIKFEMDNKELKESRMIEGNWYTFFMHNAAMSFAKKGSHNIKLLYKQPVNWGSEGKNQNCPESIETDVRCFTVLEFDANVKDIRWKQDEKQTTWKFPTFKKSPNYLEVPINDEGLKVFSTTEGPRWVLFRYHFSSSSIATEGAMRLALDKTPLPESISYLDGRPYYGFFGWGIQQLPSGMHKLRLEYLIDNTVETDPQQFDYQGTSIGATILPKTTESKAFVADKAITVAASADWVNLGNMVLNINLKDPRSVFIFYNVNLKLGGGVMATRLTVDGEELVPGRCLSSTGSFGNLQGHAAKSLPAGKHKIAVEYKAASEWKIDPNDPKQCATINAVFFQKPEGGDEKPDKKKK